MHLAKHANTVDEWNPLVAYQIATAHYSGHPCRFVSADEFPMECYIWRAIDRQSGIAGLSQDRNQSTRYKSERPLQRPGGFSYVCFYDCYTEQMETGCNGDLALK